jgi:hypothetical protein
MKFTGTNEIDKYSFCHFCGSKLTNVDQNISQFKKLPKNYQSTFGIWEVTTKGDCEGKTPKNLGTYKGHIDEIALYLANKCYYSLHFSYKPEIETINFTTFTPREVSVVLAIDSHTWNMNKDDLVSTMKELFKDRPVDIEKSNYFASFMIKSK